MKLVHLLADVCMSVRPSVDLYIHLQDYPSICLTAFSKSQCFVLGPFSEKEIFGNRTLSMSIALTGNVEFMFEISKKKIYTPEKI